jgi:hypothetical protein
MLSWLSKMMKEQILNLFSETDRSRKKYSFSVSGEMCRIMYKERTKEKNKSVTEKLILEEQLDWGEWDDVDDERTRIDWSGKYMEYINETKEEIASGSEENEIAREEDNNSDDLTGDDFRNVGEVNETEIEIGKFMKGEEMDMESARVIYSIFMGMDLIEYRKINNLEESNDAIKECLKELRSMRPEEAKEDILSSVRESLSIMFHPENANTEIQSIQTDEMDLDTLIGRDLETIGEGMPDIEELVESSMLSESNKRTAAAMIGMSEYGRDNNLSNSLRENLILKCGSDFRDGCRSAMSLLLYGDDQEFWTGIMLQRQMTKKLKITAIDENVKENEKEIEDAADMI